LTIGPILSVPQSGLMLIRWIKRHWHVLWHRYWSRKLQTYTHTL